MNTLLFLSLVSFSFTSQSGGKLEKGSGKIKEEARTLPAFSGISLVGGIEAQLTAGPAKVQVKGDDNLLPFIETEVKGGVLHVRFKDGQSFKTENPLSISIQAPAIDSIRLSGSSVAKGEIKAQDKLDFKLTGGSRIQLGALSGRNLDIRLDGSSEVKLKQFTGKELDIKASGGSSVTLADVKVDSSLIQASGSSDIEIRGTSDRLDADLSGGTSLKANQWKIKDAKIDCSGSSDGELKSAAVVHGSASGGSTVYVAKTARADIKRSGAAELIQD